MSTDAHTHDWDFMATELGDILAQCPCGHERLITGKLVRGRAHPTANWQTPTPWNRPRERRQQAEGT